jgi:hypothetical protein
MPFSIALYIVGCPACSISAYPFGKERKGKEEKGHQDEGIGTRF